eukprot:COSAG02_NODE_331_length_24480_cov_22.114720_6_plen_98_part_00
MRLRRPALYICTSISCDTFSALMLEQVEEEQSLGRRNSTSRPLITAQRGPGACLTTFTLSSVFVVALTPPAAARRGSRAHILYAARRRRRAHTAQTR